MASIPSAIVGDDGETELISRELKSAAAITPGQTESGGTLTTVEQKEESDIASWEITRSKTWLDDADFKVVIPNVLPEKFLALLTTKTESHKVAGTASMPTLGLGELARAEKQIDKTFKRVTFEVLASIDSLPVTFTDQATTTQFGGGDVDIIYTLDTAGSSSLDEGTEVLSSKIDTLGNGLEIKITEQLHTGTWPLLTEYDQDPETQSLITTTYQVVDASSVSAPSVVNGVITRYKRIDKWRSLEIVETYSLPADYDEQRFMAHPFPSLWDYTTYNYSTACGATGPIRHGFSTMVEARLAVSYSTSKETITGLTLIPNTHHLVHDIISAVLNDAGTITYVGTCSGPITLPASDPDYSTYIASIQGTEQLISGESVLWRAGLYRNSRLYVQML
jgi:hypothetical protein